MTKKEKFLKFWNDRIFSANEIYRYIVLNMMCTKGGVDYNERIAIGCDCWKFRRDDIMRMFNDELEAGNGWRLDSYFACSETDYEDIEFFTLVKPKESKEKEISRTEEIMLKVKDLIMSNDDICCSEQSCPLWKECESNTGKGFSGLCTESEENFLYILRGCVSDEQ